MTRQFTGKSALKSDEFEGRGVSDPRYHFTTVLLRKGKLSEDVKEFRGIAGGRP